MLIYSITYFLNAIGAFVKKKESEILKVIVLILLVFISGTRYYMGGSDVYVYEDAYKAVPSPLIILKYIFTGINNGVNTNYESGYLLFSSIIKSLHFSYFGFILIWTIVFYILMVKGLEEFVSDWHIYIAVFMYKLMFYDTFISIRQGMTIAMFCFMLRYIRDRNWKVYFPLCFLALLEHNGALILFPVYFITYLPTSKRFIKIFSSCFLPTILISRYVDLSSAIMKIADFLGSSKGEHWAESIEEISLIHTLECYIIVVLILVFYDKIVSSQHQKEALLSLQIFMIAIPMFTLFKEWIVFTREKDYFVMMYGLILGYIVESHTTSVLYKDGEKLNIGNDLSGQKNASLIYFAIFIACFIGMARYVYAFNHAEFATFTSFLFKDESILKR